MAVQEINVMSLVEMILKKGLAVVTLDRNVVQSLLNLGYKSTYHIKLLPQHYMTYKQLLIKIDSIQKRDEKYFNGGESQVKIQRSDLFFVKLKD